VWSSLNFFGAVLIGGDTVSATSNWSSSLIMRSAPNFQICPHRLGQPEGEVVWFRNQGKGEFTIATTISAES